MFYFLLDSQHLFFHFSYFTKIQLPATKQHQTPLISQVAVLYHFLDQDALVALIPVSWVVLFTPKKCDPAIEMKEGLFLGVLGPQLQM